VPRSRTPRAQQPPEGSRLLKLLSINVAGLRTVLAGEKAAVLKATVERETPDVLCLNEHKLKNEDVDGAEAQLRELLPGYTAARWGVSTAKKGYSGVAVLLRGPAEGMGEATPIADPAAVAAAATEGMGEGLDKDPVISQEGRLLTLELPELLIVATYVPNSGMDLKRLAYRTDRGLESCWDRSLGEYVCRLQETKGKPVVVMGDLNCAHRVQDMWNTHERPDFPEGLSSKPVGAQYTGLAGLKKQAGLTPEERSSFSSLLEHTGLVDTFRAVHPEASGVFSYFSQRVVQNRPMNRGLRLDYVLASGALCAHLQDGAPSAVAQPRVYDSFILDECEQVADHSAVGCWVLLPPAAPVKEAAGGQQVGS
jgi:exodeoxyribonuclease-3/AP endonuclease-1